MRYENDLVIRRGYPFCAYLSTGSETAQKPLERKVRGPRTIRFLGLYRLRGQDLNQYVEGSGRLPVVIQRAFPRVLSLTRSPVAMQRRGRGQMNCK